MAANQKNLIVEFLKGLYDWYYVEWRRRDIIDRLVRGVLQLFLGQERGEQTFNKVNWVIIVLFVAFSLYGIWVLF